MWTGVLVVAAFAAAATPPAPTGEPLETAYLNGQPVTIRFEQPGGKEHAQVVGPWRFGARVKVVAKGDPSKPHDGRLNAYVVVPGDQHQSATDHDFDHNLVINAMPLDPQAGAEYDIYWALVLDPRVKGDFRAERDLILAAQEEFQPSDLLEFADMPASDFLNRQMGVQGLDDLRKFHKKNGGFPRVLIVPAQFAVRATVIPPDATAAATGAK